MRLPKHFIDLHLHLDGAITLPIAKRLAQLQNQTLPASSDEKLAQLLCIPKSCEDLNEYLKPFACAHKNTPFYISLAGVTYPSPTYHITRTKADTFVIEYVTDGAGYVFADGKMNCVGKDMVYLLVAGEKHDYYATGFSLRTFGEILF